MKGPTMVSLKDACLIALSFIFLISQGCKTPAAKPKAPDNKLAWSKPAWGRAVEGLQCRLRPDKRTWQRSQAPTFRLDIRNRGKRVFAFLPSHRLQLCQIQFDDKWYNWPSPVMIDSAVWPIAPGAQLNDIPITLHKRFGINLTPGKHIVRVAFAPEGVRAVSNPVGINILASD